MDHGLVTSACFGDTCTPNPSESFFCLPRYNINDLCERNEPPRRRAFAIQLGSKWVGYCSKVYTLRTSTQTLVLVSVMSRHSDGDPSVSSTSGWCCSTTSTSQFGWWDRPTPCSLYLTITTQKPSLTTSHTAQKHPWCLELLGRLDLLWGPT